MASRTLSASAPRYFLLSTLFALAALLCFSAPANATVSMLGCLDLGGAEDMDGNCLLDGDVFNCVDHTEVDVLGDLDMINASAINCGTFNLIVRVGGNFTMDATSSMTANGDDGTNGADGTNGSAGTAGTSGATGTGETNGGNGTSGGNGGNGNSPTSCTGGESAGRIDLIVAGTADVNGTLSATGGDGGDGGAGGNGGPGGPGGSGGPAEDGNGGQGAKGGNGGDGANGGQGCTCGDGGIVNVTSESVLESTIAGIINADGGDGGNGGSGGNAASGGPGGAGGASIGGDGGNGAMGGNGGSGGNGGDAQPGCLGGVVTINQDLTIAGTAVITANGGDGGKQGVAGDGGDGGNGGTGGSGGASNTGAGGDGANGGSGDDGGNGGDGADGADGGMITINASGDVTVQLGATITALGGLGSLGGDGGDAGLGGVGGSAGAGSPSGASGGPGSPGGAGSPGSDGNDATNATASVDINHCDSTSVVIEMELNGVLTSVELTAQEVVLLNGLLTTTIAPTPTITPDPELCKLCQIVLDKTIIGAPGKDPADDDDFCDNVTDPENPVCAGGTNVGQACDPADDTPCRETDMTVGWIGEPVEFGFCVANTGTIGVTDCMLGDTLVTGITQGPFSLEPGEEQCFTVMDTCSELISMPDTAMVTCACGGDAMDTRTAEDSADLECQEPGLEVTKDCRDTDVATEFDFKITLNNTGDTPLRNCLIEDFIETGDCPQEATEPPDETRTIAVILDIPAGGMRMTTFQDVTVEETSCNVVRATCEVVDEETGECVPELIALPAGCESSGVPHACCDGEGTGTDCPAVVPSETECKTITMTGDDECRVGMGCTTRTPGWWKNHPDQIEELGVLPVESCGFTLTTFKEITQDMCINNNEASANDTNMHQLQLIRQCAAANLNVAASLLGGGDCEGDVPGLTFLLGFCCNGINGFDGICNNASGETVIADSLCIHLLDFFNNREDTLEEFGVMLSSGADSRECRRSSKDKIINPGRNLGPAAVASKKASSSDKDAEKAAKEAERAAKRAANEAKKAAEEAAKLAEQESK